MKRHVLWSANAEFALSFRWRHVTALAKIATSMTRHGCLATLSVTVIVLESGVFVDVDADVTAKAADVTEITADVTTKAADVRETTAWVGCAYS